VLFTKTVEAGHRLGWIRYGQGDIAGARQAWLSGIAAADRGLSLNRDSESHRLTARLDFVFNEYAMVCEMANRCALALSGLAMNPERLEQGPVLYRPREQGTDLRARIRMLSEELAEAKAGAKAVAAADKQPVADAGGVPFPFDAEEWLPEWRGDASVALRNGNNYCRASTDGFLLHPNEPGQPAATFLVLGLNAVNRRKLTGKLSAGPRSPGVVVRAAAWTASETAATERAYRLNANDRINIDLALPPNAQGVNLKFSVVLNEGVTTISSSGVLFKDLRLE
jgi:hypothetical protein